MKKTLVYILIIAGTIALPTIAFTQVFSSPPPPPPDPVDNTSTTDIPFDGGLSILLAAGVGYGVKKIRGQRKKMEERKQ